MSLAKRIFAITLLISALALSGLTVLVIAQANQTLRDLSLERLSDGVTREARLLQTSIELLKGDGAFLAATETVTELLKGDSGGFWTAEQKSRLIRLFSTVMQQRPAYTQVRLVKLDESGMELVRINRVDGKARAVPLHELQAKGDRYYLHDVARLRPGQIYISQVDLNRERGVIAEPHQPVFRVGTPVFDGGGRAVAAILINIDFRDFVGDFAAARDISYFITNESGDYLRHRDTGKTFGFEFGKPARIADDYLSPSLWAQWLTRDSAFRDYLPRRREAIVLDRIPLPDDSRAPGERFLVLGATAALGALETESEAFRTRLLGLAVLVGALMAVALSVATARFARPISQITEAANRIAGGEHEMWLPMTAKAEIGVLAKALDRMLDALRAAAKSEEMAAMGRMASMIAHDLRNSLSAVKMNLQILNRRARDSDPRGAQHCGIALDQVEHMENVLDDMLIFARPDRLERDWVFIGDLVQTAVLSMLPQIEAKSLTLTVWPMESLPNLLADRAKLIRVLQNLLENALQASPSGGTVTIAASPGLCDGTHGIDIMIADQGPGIAEEDQPRIFEPFFTTRAKGTGLGLAIVKRIVKQHGGRIAVQSSGSGTTVKVSLPTVAR